MTTTRVRAPAAEPEVLHGWGRTHRSESFVAHLHEVRELTEAVVPSWFPPPLLARGGGCSYGDAATCAGGTVLDLSSCRRVLEFDHRTGQVVAEAGLTLGELARLAAPYGWSVPVLPGTPHVSLGGAVAADVHGKNHIGAGSFGRHVLRLVVAGPDLSARELLPNASPEEFWATVGGMGLTGPILVVALQLLPAGRGPATTTRRRAPDLTSVLTLLDTAGRQQRSDPSLHVVAWLDGAAPRRSHGRGLVQITRTPRPERDPCRFERARPVASSGVAASTGRRWNDVPSLPGAGLMARHIISALSRARWLVPTDTCVHLQDPDTALNPLRRADPWPALFGRAGVVQYQFVVPYGRADVVEEALDLFGEHRLPPALATLKRLGPAGPAPLSFPLDGWALALDFPARWEGLEPALRELDERVADAAGRVYLAKDSRLGADVLPGMYPRLHEWQRVRDRMDPGGLFASDLSRRLHLTRPLGQQP